MSISRRGFLTAMAGAVTAPLLPPVAATAAAPAIDGELVVGTLQPMWAVGTPGEYDWQAITADTADEAFKFYREEHGWGDEDEDGENDVGDIHEFVQRVPAWDGKSPRQLTGEDWFKANFGYHCSKCGYEASPDNGARCVEGSVYCDDCMTLPLRILDDPDDAFDLLVNDIACKGEDDVRDGLIARKEWDGVPADMWARACEEAKLP